MERFNGILDARVGQDRRAADGEFGLSIEIAVDDQGLELNFDTNERYELSLSPTGSNELLARIIAVNYYGARHGLETLSQLIAYDEFSNQLKVRIDCCNLASTSNFLISSSDFVKCFHT